MYNLYHVNHYASFIITVVLICMLTLTYGIVILYSYYYKLYIVWILSIKMALDKILLWA